MPYFERELLEELKKWTDRNEILAVKGPRQSGKTTLLNMYREWLIEERGIEKNHIVFKTLEDVDFKDQFEKNPKELAESYLVDDKKHYFLLDEFHYAEKAGKKLKLLYDTLDNVKFIVTGSSSLELTGKTAKHLVGRMFSFHLYPFSFWEFLNAKNQRLARVYSKKNKQIWDFLLKGKPYEVNKDVFIQELQAPLEEYVRYGSYPEVIKAEEEETKRVVIKNLFNTYIAREIKELLQIKESSKLRELVKVLSDQLGGIIKYQSLSDSCEIYYKKLKEFLKILEETYVIQNIKPYHKNLKTELRKNPKTYFIDLGLRNHALGNFLPLDNRNDKGEILENFIFSQLKQRGVDKINFWRTEGKAEVDFIFEKNGSLIPVEVKYKSFEKPRITKGFRSYISTYNPDRALVTTKDYWGTTRIEDTEVKFIPCCYF